MIFEIQKHKTPKGYELRLVRVKKQKQTFFQLLKEAFARLNPFYVRADIQIALVIFLLFSKLLKRRLAEKRLGKKLCFLLFESKNFITTILALLRHLSTGG